jgi:hypothetical protein
VLATVSVTDPTPAELPSLTETVTVPDTSDGIVTLKLKVPVALAVPEPMLFPLIVAVTVLLGLAPVPLIVIVSPGATFV